MATTDTLAEQDVRTCGECGQPVPRQEAVPRHGDELCEPCAEGVPPVTGPHGYVLSAAECRQAARCAHLAYDVLDQCDPEDADSLLEAYIEAHDLLDAGFPYDFWHRDAAGALCGPTRELALREKQAEQNQGL